VSDKENQLGPKIPVLETLPKIPLPLVFSEAHAALALCLRSNAVTWWAMIAFGYLAMGVGYSLFVERTCRDAFDEIVSKRLLERRVPPTPYWLAFTWWLYWTGVVLTWPLRAIFIEGRR
jgi:hypothetical protein